MESKTIRFPSISNHRLQQNGTASLFLKFGKKDNFNNRNNNYNNQYQNNNMQNNYNNNNNGGSMYNINNNFQNQNMQNMQNIKRQKILYT